MYTCERHSTRLCDCVVVYDGRNCPLCKSEEDLADKDKQISELEHKLEIAEDQKVELQNQIDDLNDQIVALQK